EDVVINQATVNEGTIVNATIQNADITGTLMGVKGIFEGEFRIRGVVREEIDGNIQHPEYNNWNIDAKMNGLEFTSRVHNGIYTKTYGIDPTKVYSENTGGRDFGGYELLGLGTDGYTELNALHGQHLVLGIKANGMDSSQTKVMAMNPNYTYIYNTLDVDKINMGNIRLYEDTADSRRFKIDTGTNKPSIWMDPVRENIYIRNSGSNLVTLFGSKNTTFHGSVSVEGDLDVNTGNVMRSNVWQASNSSYLRMQTSYKAEVLAVNSTTSYMPIKASKHETGTSLRGNKKNVEECTTDVLSWIENMGMYHYNVISDVDDTVGYFGVMVDETPDFIHSDDNDSIDLYAFSTFNSLGIKQLYNRVKNIETHLGL